MERPEPRVALGLALRGVATSAIDVSDGLLGDLGHILARSAVGATIEVDAVPRGAVLAAQPPERQREFALAGGDDYELLFTAPPEADGGGARRRAGGGGDGEPHRHASTPAPGCGWSTRRASRSRTLTPRSTISARRAEAAPAAASRALRRPAATPYRSPR